VIGRMIAPCLWYDGEGLAAAERYVSLFPDSRIDMVARFPEGGPAPAGSVMLVEFTLAGQRFQALNGGPGRDHGEAISMSVEVADQAELDRVWDGLIAGGGASIACGWLRDPWGVRWQIVPAVVGRVMAGPDDAARSRMLAAVWSMVKLDVAAIEAAARGEG
jgi:predicted 3-demethylubiquinone-9 3-methyltransferase (glyoxalase superfamily)